MGTFGVAKSWEVELCKSENLPLYLLAIVNRDEKSWNVIHYVPGRRPQIESLRPDTAHLALVNRDRVGH
jgi:hypothetical protein